MLVVVRRERSKTVCARGASLAAAGGRSSSPLVVMAHLIGFLGTFLLGGAAVGYALFVLRRFGPGSDPRPRGWRLALFWLAALLGVVAFIIAMLGVGHVGGFVYCSAQFSPNDVWPCSLAGRLSYGVGSLGIGLPLLALWMRFANRMLAMNARP